MIRLKAASRARWIDLLALNLAREVARDRGEPGVDAGFRDIVESDFDSGQRADLGDPRAHLAGPDHPDFVYVHFIRPQRKSSRKSWPD